MTGLTLILLAVIAVVGALSWPVGERRGWSGWPAWLVAAGMLVLLVVAAVLAWAAGPAVGAGEPAVVAVALTAAVTGGACLVPTVLVLAEPRQPERERGEATLRGGAWIGVLERLAVVGTLLAGWPEGLAVALAVKGLGRYAELRDPAVSERFIVGTFASLLWAVGVAVAARLALS